MIGFAGIVLTGLSRRAAWRRYGRRPAVLQNERPHPLSSAVAFGMTPAFVGLVVVALVGGAAKMA